MMFCAEVKKTNLFMKLASARSFPQIFAGAKPLTHCNISNALTLIRIETNLIF